MKKLSVGVLFLSLVGCSASDKNATSNLKNDHEESANESTIDLVEKRSAGTDLIYLPKKLQLHGTIGQRVDCKNARGKLELNFYTVTSAGLYTPMIHLCKDISEVAFAADSNFYDIRETLWNKKVNERLVSSIVYERTVNGTTEVVPFYFELIEFTDGLKQFTCYLNQSSTTSGVSVDSTLWEYDRKDVCSTAEIFGLDIDLSADLKSIEVKLTGGEKVTLPFFAVPNSSTFPH